MKALPVEQVPVGSFFLLKPQGGNLQLAFMGNQVANSETDYAGRVVLLLPQHGPCTFPRKAEAYRVGVGAVLPEVEIVINSDSVVSSSTEALRLPMGTIVVSEKGVLLPVMEGELNEDNFISLETGDVMLNEDAGTWLAFEEYDLRLKDGTVIHSVKRASV